MTISQRRRRTFQHVSCPTANTSTRDFHKIRLAHFNHESNLLHELTARQARMNTNLGRACVSRAGCGIPTQRTFSKMDESGSQEIRKKFVVGSGPQKLLSIPETCSHDAQSALLGDSDFGVGFAAMKPLRIDLLRGCRRRTKNSMP